jgi:hypothetical protein
MQINITFDDNIILRINETNFDDSIIGLKIYSGYDKNFSQ